MSNKNDGIPDGFYFVDDLDGGRLVKKEPNLERRATMRVDTMIAVNDFFTSSMVLEDLERQKVDLEKRIAMAKMKNDDAIAILKKTVTAESPYLVFKAGENQVVIVQCNEEADSVKVRLEKVVTE